MALLSGEVHAAREFLLCGRWTEGRILLRPLRQQKFGAITASAQATT